MKLSTKKIAIFILLAIGLLFGGTLLTSKSKKTVSTNVLHVGTNAEFAPFSFVEEGRVMGFEIDLIKLVAQKIGKEIVIVDLPWDALIPELRSGSVDVIAAGMTITDERAKAVSFTEPYLDGEPLVACFLKDYQAISTEEDIFEHSIVVNDGYTADFFVTEKTQKEPLRVQSPIDALMALKSGRAEVYVLAQSVIQPLKKNLHNTPLHTVVIEGTSENCAMMVAKGNPELLKSINQALSELKAEGKIEALRKKWGV